METKNPKAQGGDVTSPSSNTEAVAESGLAYRFPVF